MISTRRISKQLLIGGVSLAAAFAWTLGAAHAAPVAIAPYTLTTFAGPPTGATAPDDIAVSEDGTDLWVGYGNGACTFGPSAIGPNLLCPPGTPANSSLVEFDISSGTPLLNISIPGHLDGLKIDPTTDDVWATQNEDGNPTMAIVKHKTGKFTMYTVTSALITGGMDDLVFDGKKSKTVYVTSSSQADTTTPAIVQFTGKPKKSGKTVFTSTLTGAPATVFNVVTNATETGDEIGDPDSMTLDPAGELVVCNRSNTPTTVPGGNSLFIVRASTATNRILRVPLTENGTSVAVDDTIFTTSLTSGTSSTAGTVFITDTSANAIYMLSKPYFPANEVYTAVTSTEDVDLLDMNTGIATPVVTGFTGVHGLAFSPTSVATVADTSK